MKRLLRKRRNITAGILLATLGTIVVISLENTWGMSKRTERWSSSSSGSLMKSNAQPNNNEPLQFYVAGFAKCGTTTLLKLFEDDVPETSMYYKEVCQPFRAMYDDDTALVMLQNVSQQMDSTKLKGIKCPGGVKNTLSIQRMSQFAPHAKWIVGVRHPVLNFESYYNYRVADVYDKYNAAIKKKDNTTTIPHPSTTIPAADSLMGLSNQWRAVSTDIARYELFLMQLGKTPTGSIRNTKALFEYSGGIRQLKVIPNNITLFLYSLPQLGDSNVTRLANFRSTLQHFLGIQQPLPAWIRRNENEYKYEYPESLRICQQHALRKLLMKQARRTAQWIEWELTAGVDVTIANKEHFVETIQSWYIDPCEMSNLTTRW